MENTEKKYVTTREAANLLNVAVSTVQVWSNNGLLQAWKTSGGHRRISRESVDNLIIQQQNQDHIPGKPIFSVLIVEDNEQQLMLYEKHFSGLSKDNLKIEFAKDGYEGLLKIGRMLPDIVITDLNMPNLNGFKMLQSVKEMPELDNCYFIVVSSLTEYEITMQGGLPENVQYFMKPIPFDNLKKIVIDRYHENSKVTYKNYYT